MIGRLDPRSGVMKEFALIRSMNNKEGNHQRATYQLHTGYSPTGTVKHPSLGCVAAAELGDPKFDLPHIVSIGGGTIGAGMLGVNFEPFVVQDPLKPPANTMLPGAINANRFQRRLNLMSSLEHGSFETTGGADRVKDHQSLYRQTARLILSPRMKAFQLEEEPSELRAAYGQTPFGQGCLLARRLVQAGVTFVEVKSNGWDHHQEVHDKVAKLAGEVDPAISSLITDLKSKGMLDRTLVVWLGEFGRNPRINRASAGREHWPRCYSMAMAGGGIAGGQVYGASDRWAAYPALNPVSPDDVGATILHALGIDPATEVVDAIGRPLKINNGTPITTLFA